MQRICIYEVLVSESPQNSEHIKDKNMNQIKLKIFERDSLVKALLACKQEGYRPAFIPEIVDIGLASNSKKFLYEQFDSQSLRVIGKTKKGNCVVAFAHIPNYYSISENIEKSVKQGLTEDRAGIIPQRDFQRLVDRQDDKNVFVLDYTRITSWSSGLVSLNHALNHPQTAAFFGGQERAYQYLSRMDKLGISIHIIEQDQFNREPVGRLLPLLGNAVFNHYIYGKLGMHSDGQFIGLSSDRISRNSLIKVSSKLESAMIEVEKDRFLGVPL